MSCRVQNGVAVLPNGKESELFKSLVRATGNVDEATNLYEQVHSKSFVDWFGNWDTNYTPNLFTDNNGEPKLVPENGYWSFKNNKGQSWEIAIEIKELSTALNIGRDVQEDLINTLIGFISNVRLENPNIFRNNDEVAKYFGLGKDSDSKGDLADKLLQEAFEGATLEQAKESYNILKSQGAEAMYDALPDNVNLNENGTEEVLAWEVFIGAYDRWNSKTNPITKSVERMGTREVLVNSLSNYGMKIQDRVESMEEFEDTPEKIYSMSSFQEDPRTKLSAEAKAIIGNIQLEELNVFGYPKVLSIGKAYSIISEAFVGEPTYSEMVSNLDFYAEYKPEAVAVKQKLEELTAEQEAALFTNFKTAYNNFILFKSEAYQEQGSNIVSYVNKIINSNQSLVSKKSKERFKQNSRQRTIPNERALYQIDPLTGNIAGVKEGAVEKLESLWNTINKVKEEKKGEWSVEDIEALGEYLWTLGMDVGPTLADTQANLVNYYLKGNQEGDKANILFSKLVFTPLKTFRNFLGPLKRKNPADIYQVYGTLVDTVADINILFDSKPFGSFISGTGKLYDPVNLPSRLNELVSAINNPKETGKTIDILNQFLNDPLFRPYGSLRYSSPVVSILHQNKTARENFIHEVLDSYKASDEFVSSMDYDNQSSKISLIERLIAYNNNGNKTFTKIAVPIQAGRQTLDFITIPRVSSYGGFGVLNNKTDLIKSIIIQDLARIDQANEAIMEAFKNQDSSALIEGYHYSNPADPYAADGTVFSMTQISNLENTTLKNGSEMSDYTKAYATGADFLQKDEFESLLNDKISEVEKKIEEYEESLKDRLELYDIKLLQDVNNDLNTPLKQDKFIKDFIFENFIGKIEVTKILRSGFSFAKNTEAFYKRMALLKTPGNKLFLKGMSERDPNYGMPETYNAVTIKDFDFTEIDKANNIADSLKTILIGQEVDMFQAEDIVSQYRSLNKSDAQAFISLDMYRSIMQGMGQWNKLDQQAYKNAKDPDFGLYVDNNQNPRPIYPLKPFHEEISLQDGVNALFMDKNSYTVVTPELAKSYPYLQSMLEAMNKGIDVVNTESATKGARKDVQDFQTTATLEDATIVIMDSSMLRFPQIMPRTKKDDIAFNRQIRKNLVANINPLGSYELQGRLVPGADLIQTYAEAVAANIAEDTKNIKDSLGITRLEKLRGKEGTEEYRDAKLNYLMNIRDRVTEQIKDRDLPDNYLEALKIVPNGMFDWEFKIPLSFPNYQAKFEGIFMSMFHNELFNQKLKGQELVQVAELGGHVLSGELEFYDGVNAAQIRVKASTLGLDPNTDITDIPLERLTVIGYRIPQQGKNSSLVMEVVDFLPESHEKAVMVPGGITVQMGSDFDVDKLNLIFPEVDIENSVIKPDYSKEPLDMNRLERNNVVFDTFRSILKDPKHLKEVITPLDNNSIKDARKFLADKIGIDSTLDYNNPMAELDMEERAKLGSALIGLWSNQLAGRNVAESVKVLSVKSSHMPIIDGKPFAGLGKTKDVLGNYTDANISEHLSSAVDYANDPIQASVNDNIYTNPVLGMFYSAGIPIKTALNFVNQPIIREVTKYAADNALSPGKFKEAIEYVAKSYNIKDLKTTNIVDMSSNQMEDNLTEPEDAVQIQYLINFNKFYLAGKALQIVNKIITPDNLDNVTELSSISAWLEVEQEYLNNPESLIQGAEEIIVHNQGTTKPLSPISIAYRGIFDTIIKETNRIGFLNNTPAFTAFKENLQDNLGKSKFTADQHKLIDRALFLKIMTQPNSPFVDGGVISQENFINMYISPTNNLVTRAQYIKEAYPSLENNLFVQALQEDPSNSETGLYLLRLDIPIGISTADKNDLTQDLLRLIESNDENIRNFGRLLVGNQILTSGFNPTFGSYIDLIPSEVLTTRILNQSKESPVEFFKQEAEELMKTNYFNDFVHDFVRTYGLQKPKGAPLLKVIKNLPSPNNSGVVSFQKGDARIYGDNNINLDYFLSSYQGKSTIFVNVEGGKYQVLSLLGKSRKVNEFGAVQSNSESLINEGGTVNKPGPRFQITSTEIITENEDSQAQKICKI